MIGKIIAGALGVTAVASCAAAAVLYDQFLKTGKNHYSSEPPIDWLEWAKSVEHQKVYMDSPDGFYLHAEMFDNNNDSWIMLVHGYDSDWRGMLGFARLLYSKGFSILMPDMRGFGLSGDNETSMGHFESRDIVEWSRMLVKEKQAKNIILFGVSMGAATVMLASALELPEQVRAVIEDCGYSSVKDELEHHLKTAAHIPPYPVLWIGDAIARARKGWSLLKDGDCAGAVSRTKLPILFIHGEGDTFVPYRMHKILYDACCSPDKESLTVPGANHTEAYAKAPELYTKTILDFIRKHSV